MASSASSIRTVPVGAVVIDELAAHLATHPTRGEVFTDDGGGPLEYRRRSRLLPRPAHFFAAALIWGGARVKQVQTVLGHASAVITLKVYSHLWPGTRTEQGPSWTPRWLKSGSGTC